MRLKHRLLVVTFAMAVGCLVAASTIVTAPAQGFKSRLQYAAKFICGVDPPGSVFRILPGQYATAISIHNPDSRPVALSKRIALTFPALTPPGSQQEPGAVSDSIEHTLQPGESLMVDCQEMPGEFNFPVPPLAPPYVVGFLVIDSDRSLDVTAAYTAGSTGAGGDLVRSLAVESIRERKKNRDD